MKKLISVIICVCMAVTSYASTGNICEFEYEELGITIVFDNNSSFSNSERQYIADILVYGNPTHNESSTYALCWLTGHDFTYDSVSAIQHKVSSKAPRCYETIYEIETCTKCDHVETSILATMYIDCCPEDSSET